jgi:hypothetical protein
MIIDIIGFFFHFSLYHIYSFLYASFSLFLHLLLSFKNLSSFSYTHILENIVFLLSYLLLFLTSTFTVKPKVN